jgi:hypothetical protein
MVVVLGLAQVALAVPGCAGDMRYMEDVLPDAIPGAVVTGIGTSCSARRMSCYAVMPRRTAFWEVSGRIAGS